MSAPRPIDRLAAFFRPRSSVAAWVARRRLRRPARDDKALRRQLASMIEGRIGPDGSIGGSTMATVGAARDLVALGRGEAAAPLARWLLGRAGQPGAFGEGCTAARHRHRLCEHFLGGFLSPAAPTERAAPVTLPNGKSFRTESHARFAISCAALGALVRAGLGAEPLVERHLDSFGYLVDEWARWGEQLPPDLAFSAIGALAAASDRWRDTTDALVEVVARRQLPDGTWPRVDFFHALDNLIAVAGDRVVPLLERTVPGLLARQRDDGSFGSVAPDERALVGLSVLLRVRPSILAAAPGSGSESGSGPADS